ncbi:hypothetical protein [Peribacillus sp. SCS-155]|uniref:hypothetical protein n=1 Tax=Peribacillus sedimenti TaxID=3115297 RepID=UPI0039065023
MNKSSILSDSELAAITHWISSIENIAQFQKKQRIKMAKKCMKLNYKIIGKGCNRIVYELNDQFVIKIAISVLGIENNLYEHLLFKYCPPPIRHYFCPIIEKGEGWIIMKKMMNCVPEGEPFDTKINKMIENLQNGGIEAKDLKRGNMALSKSGEIVLLDYGNFSMPSKGIIYFPRGKCI